MEWSIHEEDLKGIRAAGEACQYWLCETAKLRKQGPERNQPMALFVKPNGQSRFVFHSCHEHLRKAAQAAEALELLPDLMSPKVPPSLVSEGGTRDK